MNIYKVKTIIDGFKLGKKYLGRTFVAIPAAKVVPGLVVEYKGLMMRLHTTHPEHSITFKDKFGRGSYTLWYYFWEPTGLWGQNG